MSKGILCDGSSEIPSAQEMYKQIIEGVKDGMGIDPREIPEIDYVVNRVALVCDILANTATQLDIQGILDVLTVRLQRRVMIEDWLTKHEEEISKIEIKAPLIVSGLYRTGTTLLFNLLATDSASRAPLLWEMALPAVPPPKMEERFTDPRCEMLKAFFQEYAVIPAKYQHIHAFSAEWPEETIILMHHLDFMELGWKIIGVPGMEKNWPAFVKNQDKSYRFVKRFLQMLAWNGAPTSHWILKNPMDMWFLPDLLKIFPDAKFIFLHREMGAVVSSSLSMQWLQLEGNMWKDLTPQSAGKTHLWEMTKALKEAHLFKEKYIPESQKIDVQYTDLSSDYLHEVKRIYNHFGYKFTEQFQQNMIKWFDEHPAGKNGPHEHKLEDWGLTKQDIQNSLKTVSKL